MLRKTCCLEYLVGTARHLYTDPRSLSSAGSGLGFMERCTRHYINYTNLEGSFEMDRKLTSSAAQL